MALRVVSIVFVFIMAASLTSCRGLQLMRGSNSSFRDAERPDADPSVLAAGGSAARSAVSEALDIAYDTGPLHKVDLYWSAHQPKRPSKGWPAVIIVHGKGGSKKGYKNFCKHHIVLTGRLCVASDYRTSDQHRQNDIYNMFTWFWKKAADKYKVDKSNIVLGGYSQGSLTINNIIWDKKQGKDLLEGSTPKVKAVMMLSGVWNHHQQAKRAKYFPKSTFIQSSDTDHVVPFKYSTQLYQTLDKMGKTVAFTNISGAGHNPMHSKYRDQFYDSILRWLGKTVPGAKPSDSAAGGSAARSAVSEALDIAYDTGPLHKVDLYWSAHQPKRPRKGWPAVIIVHGKGGSKKGYKNFCKHHIVLTGRLCVASDYRTSDQHRQSDIYNMFTWFWKKAADKYKVDKSNIVLGGYSQGSLTINNIIWDKKQGKDLLEGSTPKVKAVMMLSGVWNHHQQAKRAKYFPKSTFIQSSDTDHVVPFKYSTQLYQTLDKMGKTVAFTNISGAGHNPMHSKYKDQFYDSILRWLGKTVPGA